MHDTEQHASEDRSAVIDFCTQSLDLADALQSIETQRLKLMIERRKRHTLSQVSSQNFNCKMIPVRQPDVTVGSRRAA
ncbi:MAG: hypothetical protein MK102_14705 [Fuerstiella sp.]|nr:hypothetical protein [Fuerstiella sp.]